MSQPVNLAEAEALAPGLTPVHAEANDSMVTVEMANGDKLAINDPELVARLGEEIRERHELTLVRSDRAMTDCRPISLFSIQSTNQLAEDFGTHVDKRRFRANIYLNLDSGRGFGEDDLVGSSLRIGAKAVIAVTERDPRCKMITLDPDTARAIQRSCGGSHARTEVPPGFTGRFWWKGPFRRATR